MARWSDPGHRFCAGQFRVVFTGRPTPAAPAHATQGPAGGRTALHVVVGVPREGIGETGAGLPGRWQFLVGIDGSLRQSSPSGRRPLAALPRFERLTEAI